jgi:hypothetical protein
MTASVAVSTIAAPIAPPPPPAEVQVRPTVADQPTAASEGARSGAVLRYFRFNLKYDAANQQLYVIFKNPVSGAITDQTPRNSSPVTQTVSLASVSATSAPAPRASAGSGESTPTPVVAGPKFSAPSTAGAPGAPGEGSSSGGGSEVSRGSAVDSRI